MSFGVPGRRGWEAEGEGFLAGMEGAWEPGSPVGGGKLRRWHRGQRSGPKTELGTALVPITCRTAASGTSVSMQASELGRAPWAVNPFLTVHPNCPWQALLCLQRSPGEKKGGKQNNHI